MVFAQNGRHFHGVHQVAGLISIGFMVFQSILGTVARLRWRPGRRPGALEKWHWLIGKFTLIIGIGNLAMGVMRVVQEGHKPGYAFYASLGAFYLVVALGISILEIYYVGDDERWAPSQIQSSETAPLVGFSKIRRRPRVLAVYAILLILSLASMVISIYKDTG